ncbi:MAG: glycosyltransferase family 2 protein [Lachnospiraceae bacterium]|nr:glycosyltransferase family 2 protein [Lachnospiraceae bacterium]
MKNRLAIVVPCYQEEEMLPITVKELGDVLGELAAKGKIARDSFVLFVDDGSRDKTWQLISEYHDKYPYVEGLKLAGNVGHQFALTAGMLCAMKSCDMLISIDADLQDDTDVMEEMIDKFHDGCDIVYGVRNDRKKDSLFKRTTAEAFYKFMAALGVKTIYNHADYRLMSKRAVEHFAKFEETNLYIRGIVPMLGYRTDQVYYERKERVAGESKYPLGKMLSLAWNGITSFSVKPINFVTTLGGVIIFLCILAGIYALISYGSGHVVPGWTSLILSVWLLGGLQLFAIGLVGQYIGKIYLEVKHRPRYQVETYLESEKD